MSYCLTLYYHYQKKLDAGHSSVEMFFFSPRYCSIWWTLMPHIALTCLPRSFACPGMSNNSVACRTGFSRLSVLTNFHRRLSRALRLPHSTEAHETACSAPELHWRVNQLQGGRTTTWLFPVPHQSPSKRSVYLLMNSVKSSTMNFLRFCFLPSTRIFFFNFTWWRLV